MPKVAEVRSGFIAQRVRSFPVWIQCNTGIPTMATILVLDDEDPVFKSAVSSQCQHRRRRIGLPQSHVSSLSIRGYAVTLEDRDHERQKQQDFIFVLIQRGHPARGSLFHSRRVAERGQTTPCSSILVAVRRPQHAQELVPRTVDCVRSCETQQILLPAEKRWPPGRKPRRPD